MSESVSTRQLPPGELPPGELPPGELANAVTHGLGVVLGLVASIFLVSRAWAAADPLLTAGCIVFAITLEAVYIASTLSHWVVLPRWRRLFRRIDQACIYLLIVGTYTPFGLAHSRVGWWGLFLAAMWALALVGFYSKLVHAHRVERVAIWIYVLLGWMPVIPGIVWARSLPPVCFTWMLAGGACYTVGAVLLIYDYLHHHLHAVWHLLVIAGSACHFVGIWYFVVAS